MRCRIDASPKGIANLQNLNPQQNIFAKKNRRVFCPPKSLKFICFKWFYSSSKVTKTLRLTYLFDERFDGLIRCFFKGFALLLCKQL
jgi:hypothetical protein